MRWVSVYFEKREDALCNKSHGETALLVWGLRFGEETRNITRPEIFARDKFRASEKRPASCSEARDDFGLRRPLRTELPSKEKGRSGNKFFFCWPKTLRQLKCAPLINKRRTLNHMPNRTHHVLHLGNLPCCCRVSLFQVLCIYHPKSYPCSGINFAFLLGTTGKGLRNLFKVFVGKKHFEVCWNGFRS